MEERAEIRQELAITTASSIAYLLQMSGEQVGMITNGLDAVEEALWEVKSHQVISKEESRIVSSANRNRIGFDRC